MKQLIIGLGLTLASCAPVAAHHTGAPIDGKVKDHYRLERVDIPHTRRVCEQRQGASSGDVLGGMIIGGIFGKALSGDDKGAGVGAVIGGMIAADENRSSVGTVCRDVTTYHQEQRSVYSHSIVTFTLNGRTYRLRFQK